MSNSKVLLINLTSSITELAKNLVLSGVSLLIYDDQSVVDNSDIETNFFLSQDDIGNKVN